MFKSARWKSEKSKIKAVFKFQFQATQVPLQGWEELTVSLFPADSGKPTARSEKAVVVDGSCNWPIPVYDTVKLTQDSKTGMINEKSYQFFLSATGSVKLGVLGEVAINLADYSEAFKPSSISLPLKPTSSATLHITVQRVQGESEGRGRDDDVDLSMKQQRNTLRSQLSNSELEEEKTVTELTNDIKFAEEALCVNKPAKMKFPPSQTTILQVESDADLRKSNSLDAISASGSESSSGIYTPMENGTKISLSPLEYGSLLSPLSSDDTPRDPIIARCNDWSIISAPYESLDGSSSSSGEALLREGSQGSDNIVEKLNNELISVIRQLEVSKLELQTLRKQVVKESRRGQDLSRELQSVKDERSELERECVELKASKKRAADEEHASSKLRFGGEDPWSMLEEAKQELNHEKSLNANLQLQLKKTHESNSELILEVRDLEVLLQQKNGVKPDIMEDLKQIKSRISMPLLQNSENQQESVETSTHEEDEQYALDVLVKQTSEVNNINSLDLYKEHEEIEMQMEQLALDYEILKQENHDISTKLEQIQLREQLRMQCESSSHFVSISELEAHVENLEKEIERQAEAFRADLEIISRDKAEQEKRAIEAEETLQKSRLHFVSISELEAQVENLEKEIKRQAEAFRADLEIISRDKAKQEKRAIEAEEALQKSRLHFVSVSELEAQVENLEKEIERQAEAFRADLEIINRDKAEQEKRVIEAEEALQKARLCNHNIAEQMQGEFKRLTSQLSSSFYANEKLVMQTLKEFSELQMQKCHLEEMLEKTKKELELASHQHQVKSQQLISLIDFKTKEVDSLFLELKQKRKELENQKVAEEERQRASSEQIAKLASEVEKLSRKSEHLTEQIILKDSLLEEMDQLKASFTKSDMFLQDYQKERSVLSEKLSIVEDEAKNLRQELNDLRQLKIENDAIIRNLKAEITMHREQYDGLRHTMSENELEKENLRKQVLLLRGDLRMESAIISVIDKRTEEHNAILSSSGTINSSTRSKIYESSQARHGFQDASLHQKTQLSEENRNNEDLIPYPIMNVKPNMKDVDSIGVVELVISNNGENPEVEDERSIFCACEQQKVGKILGEMTELKEQNEMMETELKDMQQRYSEMSLKFAEVEGERQLLVIKIRSLKNALKT